MSEQPIETPKANLDYNEWLRYQDLLQGIIRLDEPIRDTTVSRLLGELALIERRQLPQLTLIISSPGGGAYNAFALYDRLRELSQKGIKIIAVVDGWAASAAAMIVLQAADERTCYPSARFLLHEARRWIFWAVERTSDLKDEVEEMEKITERILDVLATRCNRTKDEIQRKIERKEIWMSATEAKEWGLIDKII